MKRQVEKYAINFTLFQCIDILDEILLLVNEGRVIRPQSQTLRLVCHTFNRRLVELIQLCEYDLFETRLSSWTSLKTVALDDIALTNPAFHTLTQLSTLFIINTDKNLSKTTATMYFPRLTYLSYSGRIHNEYFKYLTTLTNLRITSTGPPVSLPDFVLLTRLDTLDISYSSDISDRELSTLTNLTKLELAQNEHITDESLSMLTNLKSLSTDINTRITCNVLQHLTGLKSLTLYNKNTVPTQSFPPLINLTALDISHFFNITDKELAMLSNLKKLELNQNISITDKSVSTLTKLNTLSLCNNITITGDALSRLIGLEILSLYNNNIIITQDLISLTNLTELDIGNTRISTEILYSLPRMKLAHISKNARFFERPDKKFSVHFS
jgi:hypothetical protein